MIARNVSDLKRGLAMSNGDYAAFTPEATDEDIRNLCHGLYGWEKTRIERTPTIVLCKPYNTRDSGNTQT